MRRIALIQGLFFLFTFVFPLSPSADSTNPLTGMYYGTATITLPANLGTVDLAFYLDVTGMAIQHDTSYIVLEKTLLFPAVPPQVGSKDVGPRVTGTLSLTGFSLTTDPFESTVVERYHPDGRPLIATRQIVLSNTKVADAGNAIGGDFTETITDLDKNPIIVKGTFILIRPSAALATGSVRDLDNNGCLDIDEIKAGGNDPSMVEYSDISYALRVYNNPSMTPNICEPKDQIINNALTGYYGSLK
jgi:hypothetical protein